MIYVTLVANGEMTKALLVWPHHLTQHFKHHPARHPGGQETTGPSEKKLARQHKGMDRSKPTNPATHNRGQTMLAWTVCVDGTHMNDLVKGWNKKQTAHIMCM